MLSYVVVSFLVMVHAITKITPVTLTLLLPAFVAVFRQFILGFVTCIMLVGIMYCGPLTVFGLQ